MPDQQTGDEEQRHAQRYEIRLRGHLDERWAEQFEGLAIRLEDQGDTLLTGPVVDQAALHGLLKIVRDVGLPLVSIMALGSRAADAAGLDNSNSIRFIPFVPEGEEE